MRLPKATLQPCVQLSMHQRQLSYYPELNAEQKHILLSNCGALKNSSQLERLVKLIGLLHSQGQMELPELSFSASLWQQIHVDIGAALIVKPQDLMAQGKRGKELGDAIKAAQIEAIAKVS